MDISLICNIKLINLDVLELENDEIKDISQLIEKK
jgi:hypothetical protein